jgi:hypothetical protein
MSLGLFGTRDDLLCNSPDVERDKDTRGVLHPGGNESGCVGKKKGYVYSSSSKSLVQLVVLANENNTPQSSSCTTTRLLMTEKAKDEI